MTGIRKIIVFDEKAALADFAVKLWREAFAESTGRSAPMTAALSGGHTPVDFYRALAAAGESIQWEKVHIFLVDERFVPPTDEDSNYHMIRETLLNHVPIPEANVHPVKTLGLTPDEAASEYEKDLRRHFVHEREGYPRFDLVVLGLGADGHTASLFPGDPMIAEPERWVAAVKPDPAPHERITLTLPVLNRSRCALFLVTGAEKAKALKAVAVNGDPVFPAARVNPPEGTLLFLADREAAALLSKDSYSISGHL